MDSYSDSEARRPRRLANAAELKALRRKVAQLEGQLLAAKAVAPAASSPLPAAAPSESVAGENFLANISHEICTPMHGIVVLTQLPQRTTLSPEKAGYLDIIITNYEGVLVIINDILDFAKIEAGAVELEAIPFDVVATVHQTVRALAFQAKGLGLHTDIRDEPLPVVTGDPTRLGQVLLNLLSNALEFTNAGEVAVTVTVERHEAGAVHLRFSVADTEVGINSEKFDQVFRSFAQTSRSTTRLHGGTGLGLAVCRNLVELQGGHIWVESEAGKGSQFHVVLPYPVGHEAPTRRDDAPALAPGLLRSLHVLLVEDNDVNTLLANTLLDLWKVTTTLASDGEEALAHARTTGFDLVLMDIQLPRLSVLDATAQLRQQPRPSRQAPIIALTANALPADTDKYTQTGFTNWLAKPYHDNQLYLPLAQHTGRHQPAALTNQLAPAFSYNFTGLGRLANDAALVRKMQQLVIDTMPGQLWQLTLALEAADWALSTQLVHSLKSTFGNLQNEEAGRYIKKWEKF